MFIYRNDSDVSQLDHFTTDENRTITSWDGPLRPYDMTDWKFKDGHFVRPRPLPRRRGFGTRTRVKKFQWLRGMKDFVRSSVEGYSISTTPYMDILTRMVNHRPTWTDLTVPKISVLKSFVRNMMTTINDVKHGLNGRRNYLQPGVKVTQYEWLMKECVFQNIPIGSC